MEFSHYEVRVADFGPEAVRTTSEIYDHLGRDAGDARTTEFRIGDAGAFAAHISGSDRLCATCSINAVAQSLGNIEQIRAA